MTALHDAVYVYRRETCRRCGSPLEVLPLAAAPDLDVPGLPTPLSRRVYGGRAIAAVMMRPMNVHDLPTPALLVDVDAFEHNVADHGRRSARPAAAART